MNLPEQSIFLVTLDYSKSGYSKEGQDLVFKTDYRLMQVKHMGECSPLEHSAILLTCIER